MILMNRKFIFGGIKEPKILKQMYEKKWSRPPPKRPRCKLC